MTLLTSGCPGEQSGSDQMIGRTLSTFIGEPTRGGWKPVYTKPLYGAPILTDWVCPRCKRLTGGSRTCPECGLEVLTIPRIIFKSVRAMKSSYLEWIKNELGNGKNGPKK